jgi:hypothetical protein
MALDILRRTGGWCVELMVPIKVGVKEVDQIEIKPPTIAVMTRWQRGDIPSSMALLAELSGVPEMALTNISYPDADRVLLALYSVVPKPMQADFTAGARPLATPEELMPEPEAGTRPLAQDDPRFPQHDGPVVPLGPVPAAPPAPPPEPPPMPGTDVGVGFDMGGRDAYKRAG